MGNTMMPEKMPAVIPAGKNYKWLVLGIISLGTLMATLNSSSINLANPVLARFFALGMDQVQWVTTLYLLLVSSLMLLFGRIGDRIGGHKIYLGGLLIFTLGSLSCGLSSSWPLLLLSRAVQALGGAMLMATGMGLVAMTFPLAQRGMAMGIGILAVSVGNMCGPSLGGFILSQHDWPVIFFINVPFGLLAFLLGLRWLRSPLPRPAGTALPLDYMGALLLGVIISSLILSLSGGFAGSYWFLALFAAALPLFIRLEKRHAAPLWDFDLIGNRRFAIGNLVAFLSYFAHVAVFFLLPFFLEEIWQAPVAQVGLMLMIAPLCMAVTAPLAGMLSDKIGALRLMPVALAVLCAAELILVSLSATPSLVHLGLGLFCLGLGLGMLNTPNNSEIMTAAGPKYAGYAGGFVATIRNLAFCFGTAASAGIFSFLLKIFVGQHDYTAAYLLALRCIMAAAAMVMLAALIICLRLKRASA
jgi:EmrB/QacA subfamily drug resistance transporter